MSRSQKPYEVPLEPKLADEILNIPLLETESAPTRTIGERVRKATKAIEEANAYLKDSPLAKLVADTLMKQLKKRGAATIQVRPDGSVVLRVAYEEARVPLTNPVQVAPRKSTLPKMKALRKMATDLGLDISDLGRARKTIYARICEVQGQ